MRPIESLVELILQLFFEVLLPPRTPLRCHPDYLYSAPCGGAATMNQKQWVGKLGMCWSILEWVGCEHDTKCLRVSVKLLFVVVA